MNIVTCTACGSSQIRKGRPCIKCGAELPVLAIKGKKLSDKPSEFGFDLSDKVSDKLSGKDWIEEDKKK